MCDFLKIKIPKAMPPVPFSDDLLRKSRRDFILIFGASKDVGGRKITLCNLRLIFGIDPAKSEPCFYNQDWYLKEKFVSGTVLKDKWYLISKKVMSASRGVEPKIALSRLPKKALFPSAILMAFTFFANYFANKRDILWGHDFIWCSDTDHNGDRIYTGRYIDSSGINKNGFNIHRHLSIRPCYGAIATII